MTVQASTTNKKAIKFSDDTAIVDMSDSESVLETSVKEFSDWFTQNFLELNVGKTKEMVVNFKRDRTDVTLLTIGGQTVESVQQ